MLVNGTEVADLEEKYEQLELEYANLDTECEMLQSAYDDLREQHKWVHVLLSVILSYEVGGSARIPAKAIEAYDLRGQITFYKDPEANEYVVTAVPAAVEK